MTDRERLMRLMRSVHPCVRVVTNEEEYILSLVRDAAFETGRDLRLWSIIGGVRDGLVKDKPPIPETEHAAAALYLLRKTAEKPGICATLDLAGHLKDERTLRLLRDLLEHFANSGDTLVLIDHTDALPAVIKREAILFEPSLPDRDELETIVRQTLRCVHQEHQIEVDITKTGLRTMVRNLQGLTRRQARQIIADCVTEDWRFDMEDINTVLAMKRQLLQADGLLEYVETPVDLSEIGGLRNLKRWLRQRQAAVTDKAVDFGLSAPRGVLMLGVQGAGKSLCAKAIAAAWQRPLLRMDPGALYDRYIGESERRLRDALKQAEMMAPAVVWVDEIEKAFASAASRSVDGGLSQRMFGTLLTWMQEHEAPVFLIATANEIEALPPELLRKGRFDEIFFVDLPGKATRKQIFAIHLRKRRRDPDQFDLSALVEASDGYSGAEIEQSIIAAMHDAFSDRAELDTERIREALEHSPPLSVTMAERVESLRTWAKGRCVPAG